MVSELDRLVRENKAFRSTAEKLKSEKVKLEALNRTLKRQVQEAKEELELYRKMHGALPVGERRRLERKFKR